MRMNFLLVLRRVFSYAVKPGIQVMSFSEYLVDLNRDSKGRKICNMQVRICLENQGVWWYVDVFGIPIS